MQEDDVKKLIKTPAVLQAFDRATLSKMPKEVQELYDAEDKEYSRISEFTDRKADKAYKKARWKAIRVMKELGISNATIADKLKCTVDEVVAA